jgi:cytochrome c oxidase subunit 2
MQDPLGQLPPDASTFAGDVNGVYYLCLAICAFFFFLVTGILAYSVLKWRRRRPDQPPASMTTHNTALEVTWTLVPLVILMVMFAWGWKGALHMTVAPADSLQYQVVGQQWEWQVTHPGSPGPVINEMWVPVNRNVKVSLYSNDVLHAFFVPAFRVKRDVLPGRYQMVWFNATRLSPRDPETGKSLGYPLFCAEYCGTNHSYMIARVHVVTQEEWDTRPWEIMPTEPLELGEFIYQRRCKSCHSTDGSEVVGPSFKGVWGKEEEMADGTKVTVDEAYVTESIKQPEARKVKGYEDKSMSLFPDINDTQIAGIIEYLKTLK